MLLIVDYIANGLLLIFNFIELNEEHVFELREVFPHVFDNNASAHLVEDDIDAPVELFLELCNLGVVILVRLGVFVQPVFAILY